MKTIEHKVCPWCSSESITKQLNVIDRSGSDLRFDICSCESCGFAFTQNPPTPEEIAPFYHFDEYISHSDTKASLTDRVYHWVRSRMLEKKIALLKKHAPQAKRLLDYGTGTGYFLQRAQRDWETIGFEIDDGARQYAKEQFGLDVQDPAKIQEVQQTVDIITLWHVLEHIYDFKDKLQSFVDLLIPDGLLILALPNHQSLDARWLGRDWAAYDAPRHLWHFSPDTISLIAHQYGFAVEKMYAMPFDGYYVSILSEQIKKTNPLLSLIKGGFIGLLSNINCTFNAAQGSSIIYVLRKNE